LLRHAGVACQGGAAPDIVPRVPAVVGADQVGAEVEMEDGVDGGGRRQDGDDEEGMDVARHGWLEDSTVLCCCSYIYL
jgi:hypothetical protein